MANLVIVESPHKAANIKSFLGSNYKVIASKGHICDLPKSALGVDIENGFAAHYINIRGKGELISEIKKEAKSANKIYLATDPDREGEAIAWHLAQVLGIPVEKTLRTAFNAVNKETVKAAIKAPRTIDMNLVNAQQARRILDRIVGYKLSPFLWKRVRSGLSAGRTQSVATRIIVEREEEIRAFVPEEFWLIDATLMSVDGNLFTARFFGGANSKKIKLTNEADANAVVSAVSGKDFAVTDVRTGIKRRSPAPPFTTSTLQQEAVKKLGFQSARTMKVAQELYEGVNVGAANGGTQGLITYMRTDSQRVLPEAQNAARELIVSKYGEKFCPAKPRTYKSKNGAQDAHEAIRPVNPKLEPSLIKSYLTPEQFKLYKLIWDRFIASQMESAALSTVTADFCAAGYLFRSSGYTVTFSGYLSVYADIDEQKTDDGEQNVKLPKFEKGSYLKCDAIVPTQHFTEAPPRYTEGSLVKFLEDNGIGRPSTFATIVTTIIERDYVRRDGKLLVPTTLGEVTTKLMKESFADIVDYKFTANMENKLDDIESGSVTTEKLLADFWKDFSLELAAAEEKGGENLMPVEKTDIICEKCGATMIVRNGRFGRFAACPNYPKCRNTKPLASEEKAEKAEKTVEKKKAEPKKTNIKCEICGGELVIRNSRYGSFYACSNFPECRYTKPIEEVPGSCPKCGGKLIKRHGRNRSTFFGCEKYPQCDFSTWDNPTAEVCPKCGKTLFAKKGKKLLVCATEGCGYTYDVPEEKKNDKNEQQ